MRALRNTLLSAAAILLAAGAAAWAQDDAKPSPGEAKPADAKAFALLHAKELRAMADLIEAQNAEKPDAAKIEALAKAVEQARSDLRAKRIELATRPGAPCPWGGPGRGFGRGMGPGPEMQPGPGMGPGRGFGPGQGMGPGRGQGPGGPGCGAGAGRGVGWGPGYLAQDRDGAWDRFEARWGDR